MSSDSSKRILQLIDILQTETDEEHGLTRAEICQKLSERGCHSARSTFYQDLKYLEDQGYNIINNGGKSTTSNYRLVSRHFELAELKLLVDSVQAAKFITAKKSQLLIKKLAAFASNNDAKSLSRDVILTGRVKAVNKEILYNIDRLHDAINGNKKVRFKYFQWNWQKQMEFRHGNKIYNISPWGLVWDSEYYYMIGYDSDDKKVKHYRVDKMAQVAVSDEAREGRTAFRDFDLGTYTNSIFGMFGGKKYSVDFEVSKNKAFIFIDRFGTKIPIVPIDDDLVKITVEAELSPQFTGWIFSLGEGVKAIGPEEVVNALKEEVSRQARLYK